MSNVPCGVVMLDLLGKELSEFEREVLEHPYVGGVILFSRNFESPDQLTELSCHIKSLRPNIVIAADQEGGRVQRFKEGFTRIPPMAFFGSLMKQLSDPAEAIALVKEVAWLLAAELRAVGVDISFAPVLDVDDSFSRVIGDRSFAADADVVTCLGRAFIEGMHEAGVAATGKHFPGHGGVVADTHHEEAIDPRPLADIEARDLVPFALLSQVLDGVMPAHVKFPAVADEPVGFSPHWIEGVLRKQLGFTGLVFSDDLSMAGAAFAGDYIERAKRALSAGCNTILICNQPSEAVNVLRYLEGQPEILHSGLERMLKWQSSVGATKLTMQDLKRTNRWQQAVAKLAEMESRFGFYSK